MKAFFLAFTALVLVGFAQPSAASPENPVPAKGRFYCTAVFNWDLRMDADFTGNNARIEIYNTQTSQWVIKRGWWDDFRSNAMFTFYQVQGGEVMEFPADYEQKHWFELTYRTWRGEWIRFDCNHF
jgi:hypothetical protein